MSEKIKILIADDHTMFRESLKQVINSKSEYDVVAEANNGEQAISFVERYKPDVVLMDINMPLKNGIEASKEIKQKFSEVKIIILTMLDNGLYILDALRCNVEGFLYKDARISELLLAIDTVYKGQRYITPEIKEKVMNYITSNKFGEPEEASAEKVSLTPRQIEIVKVVAKGFTSKEIAEKLFLSELTVIKHKKNIIKKLGLRNFTEVVSYAHQEKII